MTCRVPANQPIYEALMNKAASYPADKHYQVKAYNKVAESVLTHTWDINDIARKGTWWQGQGQHVPGIGEGIRRFIIDFVRSQPTITPATPATPATPVAPLTTKEVVETVKQNVQVRAEKEKEELVMTTLIPSTETITVQKLIDTLQDAVKNNPKLAKMQFYTSWNKGTDCCDCERGPYELGIASDGVWLHTGDP